MGRETMILAALALDLLVGDPHGFPHPVRWIGRFARDLEIKTRAVIRWPLLAGGLTTLTVYFASYMIPWLCIHALSRVHPTLATAASIWVIYTTIALRSLIDHSQAVFRELSKLNLKQARYKVSRIVGRDTQLLSRKEVVRACIESVAESMVDGVTAPLFFALLLGAPGAMLYRSINTLDSIFGHRCDQYERFGKIAARIDDLANFIPARITSPLVAAAAILLRCKPMQSLKILFRDGHKHPSPNSGLSEAAMAGALGIQLGGINYYQGEESVKSYLGEPRHELRPGHILKSNRLVLVTSLLSLGMFLYIYRILCDL